MNTLKGSLNLKNKFNDAFIIAYQILTDLTSNGWVILLMAYYLRLFS